MKTLRERWFAVLLYKHGMLQHPSRGR